MRNITVADHFYCWILPAFCVMGKRAFLFKRNSTDPSQTCFLARVLARCLVLPCFIQSTGRGKIRYPSTPGGFPYWQLNLQNGRNQSNTNRYFPSDPPTEQVPGSGAPERGNVYRRWRGIQPGHPHSGWLPYGLTRNVGLQGLSARSSSLIGWGVHKGYRLTAWKEWAFHTFYS